ncbi:MAG: acyl-CoA dehydrogenase [Gammaproteobacteria bacterium]|nr:acyl-CoA dehydrogenase [Gammaproteobacteria bacterium]
MTLLIWIILIFAVLVAVARMRAPIWVWTAVAGGFLLVTTVMGVLPGIVVAIAWVVVVGLGVLFNMEELRLRYISGPVLGRIRAILPPISATEREAIEAGTVWWDAALFQGDPQWRQLLDVPAPQLTVEEQAFLDGPVEELCGMLDDWQITHELNDLPAEVWTYLKQNRFFGLNIPKQYGGLEFSALANSAIVVKVCSRSGTAGITVMVPNSLGPAELLLHYGTDEQKDHYLPRLARGEEVPCFALTNPWAGSDAGAMPDHGIACYGTHDGEKVLGFRTTWDKRYITLGPVATVLGLAFKAYDPDGLLGDENELGITCALIPTTTPGVEIGNRHWPLDGAFQNGPNNGADVFVPLQWIIGGEDGVGTGWRMLMESLAAGRGISLPASGVSAAKVAARTTGAYARIREQFNIPIGKFEGIEEPLARIGGLTYLMDAGRLLTASALVSGEKPSVISAIVKSQLTEYGRDVVNDAMDVHGGRGICLGPRNYLGRAYQQLPIAITVEGANILTRSMIIFGQGAMRCHPYLLAEMMAAANEDSDEGLVDFDRALMGHLGYAARNKARSFVYAVSGNWLAPTEGAGEPKRYYRALARMSASFAFLADTTLLILGGALKRKEKLSGRFADALSHLYLCSAALKRFEDVGRPAADRPLLDWACQHALYEIQQALDGVLRNFPSRLLGVLLRGIVFPLGRRYRRPDDALGHNVAKLLMAPSASRDRLTDGIYLSHDAADVTGCLEYALDLVLEAEPARQKIKHADREPGPGVEYADWLAELVTDGVISSAESEQLARTRAAVEDVIAVDDFAPDTSAADEIPELSAENRDDVAKVSDAASQAGAA